MKSTAVTLPRNFMNNATKTSTIDELKPMISNVVICEWDTNIAFIISKSTNSATLTREAIDNDGDTLLPKNVEGFDIDRNFKLSIIIINSNVSKVITSPPM